MSDRTSPTRLIDVAICTYRRTTIAETLRSVAAQQLPAGVAIRVIVADNDDTPSARERVADSAAALGLDCHYVHAPSRNISVARNACLDAGTAPLLAFIDDDEEATPRWIAALLARLDESAADVVLGPARAVYPAGVPAWMRTADLHSTAPPITTADAIRTGYSCNVLLRRAAFAGDRFDSALGRSGGEDDVFFATAARRGVRIAYAPDAVVDDPVPLARARLSWLCRRSFRNGQTHARNVLAGETNRTSALAVAAAKAVFCFGAASLTLWSAPRWRRFIVRGALHCGAVARYAGRRDLQLY